MFPVVEDLIIMKDENGLVYWPAFGLNSIGNMDLVRDTKLKCSMMLCFLIHLALED